MIDNTLKQKNKQKKDKLEVRAGDAPASLRETFANQVDTLAAGRKASKFIEKAVEEAEDVCRGVAYEHWVDATLTDGQRPDMRLFVGTMSAVKVSQQERAELTDKKRAALGELGIPIKQYRTKRSFKISMTEARKRGVEDKLLKALRDALDVDDYNEIVTEIWEVKASFFDELAKNAQAAHDESAGKTMPVRERMVRALQIAKPIVQFRDPASDLAPMDCYALAHEYVHISANKTELPSGIPTEKKKTPAPVKRIKKGKKQ